MPHELLFLYAESPVHAGADSSLGAVDLPMQRDGHTRLPVIWGQSLKGALRAHPKPGWADTEVIEAFGDPPPSGVTGAGGDLRPGSLSVGDAELVALPVPTLVATFAWVTSPLALGRLRRKAALAGVANDLSAPDARDVRVALAASSRWEGDQVVLGPYVVTGQSNPAVAGWATWLSEQALPRLPGANDPHQVFREKLAKDLAVVGDELLVRLSEECAEITPRVQLKTSQKTVEHGPFYTEYLPTESLLAAVIEGDARHLARLKATLHNQVLRVGGDETIGKGLMWCTFADKGQPTATAAAAPATVAAAGAAS